MMNRLRHGMARRAKISTEDNSGISLERGDTLIEILLALLIIGIGASALLLSLQTSITTSATYKTISATDTIIRSSLEEATSLLEQLPAATWNNNCPLVATPYSLTVPTGSGFSAAITTIQYWTGSAWTSTCTAGVSQFVQITVTSTLTSTGATQSLSAIVPNPSDHNVTAPGSASQLVFLQQPTDTTVNGSFSPSIQVAVEDSSGNIVTTDWSSVTLAISSGTSGTISGCVSSGVGVVTFTGCSISGSGANVVLQATDSNAAVSSTTSNSFKVLSGAPSQLLFRQSPVNSPHDVAFATQPIVTVEDANGNTVITDSSTVTLAITSGTGTSGATLSSCVGTETNGVVSFTGCAINKLGSGYTLTATDSGSGVAAATSSSFNITAGSAAKLIFTSSPSNSVVGAALSGTVQVTVEDSAGNVITGDTSTLSLAITSGTGTSGATITGCSSAEGSGVFTVSGCAISKVGSNYTLTATDGTLSSATSNSFNVTVGPATQLIFTTSPTNTKYSTAFATSPVISVEDASGNVVTTDSSTLTLKITNGTGTSGASLSGCSPAESNGVFTVTGCKINLTGTGYTLTATDGSLSSAVSNSFNITAGTPSQLVWLTQPSGSSSSTALKTPSPQVQVKDAAGNVVTSDSSTLGVSTSKGTVTCTNVTELSGVFTIAGCSVAGLSNPTSITMTVTIAAIPVTSPASSSFTVK